MTGSVSDAEDIVQRAWLRRQRIDDPVADERALLTTIVTRLSIDELRSARRRREHYVGTWLPEPLVTDSGEDPADVAARRDLLSLGVLHLFERLSPPQRAAVILRDGFGYSHGEIADVLDITQDASRQHYARAKKHLSVDRIRFEASHDRQQALLERFIVAAAGGGTEALEELLAEDVTMWGDGGGKVAAARRPIAGREHVARFLRGLVRIAPQGTHVLPVDVNGEPGLLVATGDEISVYAFTWTTDGLLHAIHGVRNPDKLSHVAVGPRTAETVTSAPPAPS